MMPIEIAQFDCRLMIGGSPFFRTREWCRLSFLVLSTSYYTEGRTGKATLFSNSAKNGARPRKPRQKWGTSKFKVYLTNTSLRAAMFQPVEKPDDPYLGAMVETAFSAQMGIGEERHAWRYANWTSGRKQGEVDFVRIYAGTQRPDLALECKWSDGPFDHPAELGSAVGFCQKNGLKRLWVTTRTLEGIRRMGDMELVYVPTALFAYQLGMGGVFK